MIVDTRYSVVRVRDKYAGPYRKVPFISLQKEEFSSEVCFKRALRKKIKNWQTGEYMLKMSSGGIFVRFEVRDGKLDKMHKDSPVTGRPYPVCGLLKK